MSEKWFPVEEKLPNVNHSVLVSTDDLLDFENLLGECSFKNAHIFLKDMEPGDVYVVHCRPNSDRDVLIYRVKNYRKK